MTGEKDAPAEMPGETLDELIDRARVAMAVYGDDGDFYGSEIIGDLIQALAEKEREKAAALGLIEGHSVVISQLEARALAAEAALAAERERCAQIAYRVCAETRHVTLGDKAAAAIRAQGE